MAVQQNDIAFYLSGGASNANGESSLGGARSSVEVNPATLINDITGPESASGITLYRCIYTRNNSGTNALLQAAAFIAANTPSDDTIVHIGLGTSAINGTEQIVANEQTAPSGVTFGAPSSLAAGLQIGDIGSNQHKALWLRLTVTAGAAAFDTDGVNIQVGGSTGE